MIRPIGTVERDVLIFFKDYVLNNCWYRGIEDLLNSPVNKKPYFPLCQSEEELGGRGDSPPADGLHNQVKELPNYVFQN